jgi:hypothetical protein
VTVDGTSVGRWAQLTDPDGIEWIIWSHAELYAIAVGLPGDALDFFGNLPY